MKTATDQRAKLVREAAVAAGLDLPEASRSRDCHSLQRGYSVVQCHTNAITARREGQGKMGTYDIQIKYDDPEWVEKCVDILRSGRTVECGEGVGMRDICERIHWQTVDYALQRLPSRIDGEDPWEVNPDYQREHVWTPEQREQFLGFLLENGRMPLIFLQDHGDGSPYEVVDGKQRLTSCLMFVGGEIPAQLSDGRRIWWKDFNEIDRRTVPNIKCAIVRLPNRAAILRFYLKLNRGGTVHSDAEIARVKGLLDAETGGSK